MEYKTIKLNSYNIHFIKTNNFKTIDMRIIFTDKFKKEEITKRNFLLDMLTYSCEKYNTKRMLSIKCQDLYSLNLSGANLKIGNYLISKIGISFLNPKYTEEGMLEESVDLLMEILFKPNAIKQKFDSKSFAIIKRNLSNELLTIKEQPKLYALLQMLKKMGKDSPYSYHGYCYEEDLDKLNEENLYEFYQQFLKTNLVDIYVVGDIEFDRFEKLIHDKFKISTLKKDKGSIFYKHKNIRKRSQKIIEKCEFMQSKLVIGLKLDKLSEFERGYVANIYNMILGGTTDSLLMQNVRLKESLVYYIFSILNKADQIITISCGIDKNNFEKTLKIIKKTLKDIQLGKISDDDIKKSQFEYISAIETAETNPNSLIDLQMSNDLKIADSIEERKKKIMQVKKEDVIAISQKISLDTVYLLEGK